MFPGYCVVNNGTSDDSYGIKSLPHHRGSICGSLKSMVILCVFVFFLYQTALQQVTTIEVTHGSNLPPQNNKAIIIIIIVAVGFISALVAVLMYKGMGPKHNVI